MSSFSRWLIAFYAMLSLFRVWIISWFEPSWSHFFERWAKGDASQVIRPHAWGLILTAIALAAIVVAILVIARTVQRRDARGWMSVSLALGGAWIVAFVWRGMPPAYNPLLWLMGL